MSYESTDSIKKCLSEKDFARALFSMGELIVAQNHNVNRISAMLDRIDAQLSQVEKKQDRLFLLMTGNGEPERGHVLRLDRIEQRERLREKWTWTAITAGFSGLVAGVIAFFKR